MKPYKFKIRRTNYSIKGHNGYGRFDLISPTQNIIRQTEKQAADVIGRSILAVYNHFLKTESVDTAKEDVEVQFSLKKVTKKGGKK